MASRAGVVWQSSPSDMARRVEDYGRRLLAAVYALANEWATRIAEDARRAAPWTDRTGLARRSIAGRAMRLAAGAVIIVSGGAPYSIYLERRWGGRYATVSPTIQRNLAAIMASLQRLVR